MHKTEIVFPLDTLLITGLGKGRKSIAVYYDYSVTAIMENVTYRGPWNTSNNRVV